MLNLEYMVSALAALLAITDLNTRRAMADTLFAPSDVLELTKESIPVIMKIRACLYNPADKGKDGKLGEVEERLIRYMEVENPRKWVRWTELHARKTGRADVGRRMEMKTGAGDWLRSLRYHTWEEIVNEYSKKETLICWKTDYFMIECKWCELLEYLTAYNAKGLRTWFKSEVVTFGSETVVRLQEWKTSAKKLRYLQACPYNME